MNCVNAALTPQWATLLRLHEFNIQNCAVPNFWREQGKKIGSTPLEIAAQDYPIEEWRVWTSTYPRDYTEDSEVCRISCLRNKVMRPWPCEA